MSREKAEQLSIFEEPFALEYKYIAGVDEAGRGPLCGDVFAAAVILEPDQPIEGLDDSKKLTEKRRRELSEEIKEKALAWAIAKATVKEIDDLNILQATLLAMRRAIEQLSITPQFVRIDGNQDPRCGLPSETIVKGDALFLEISAASILAKDARDQSMIGLDERYPEYGFLQHKGYGTKQHLAALQKYGVTPEHRQSFAPIKRLMAENRWYSPGAFIKNE